MRLGQGIFQGWRSTSVSRKAELSSEPFLLHCCLGLHTAAARLGGSMSESSLSHGSVIPQLGDKHFK